LTIKLIRVDSSETTSYRPEISDIPTQEAPELLFKLFNQQVIEYLSSRGETRQVENYLTWDDSARRFKTIERFAPYSSSIVQQKITFPKTSQVTRITPVMSTNVPSFDFNPKWLNRPFIVVNEKRVNQL